VSVVVGSILSYCLIHFLFVVKTGYSSFYWVSRMFFHLEAMQNGMIRSIPQWLEWWRYMAHEERKTMGGR
jgi:hypothetical protein